MKKLLPALSRVLLLSLLVGWSVNLIAQTTVVESQPSVPGQGGQNATGSASNNDALLLLLEQNRNLQTEMQALRGLVEEQGYEIRKLQRESLDRYTDIDSRLSGLEQSSSGGVATSTQSPISDRRIPGQMPSSTDASDANNRGNPDSFELETRSPVTSTPEPDQIATSTAPLARTTPSRPSLEPAVLSEQQLYQMAYDSAINSQFERAVAEFDQYLSIYPSGRFTANAHYWKGQAYLYLSQYDQAIASYNIIMQQYSDSAKVQDAMYGLGVAYEGLGDIPRAKQLFQEIIEKYPLTGVANLADTRLLSID
jgi:tol-pal system protein YbgF